MAISGDRATVGGTSGRGRTGDGEGPTSKGAAARADGGTKVCEDTVATVHPLAGSGFHLCNCDMEYHMNFSAGHVIVSSAKLSSGKCFTIKVNGGSCMNYCLYLFQAAD